MLHFFTNLFITSLFAVMPASGTYQLHNYGFGSGGSSGSSSANYSASGTTGEVSGTQASSATYLGRTGNNNTQQAYVPDTPTLSNAANYYNKLQFIIAPGTNPSDTLFSIAISSDNFVTSQYIQSDNTVGPVRGIEDYQTYATWGGSAGQFVTGLTPTTTYKIKVNSFQGKYTETEYGPIASAATVDPNITFDIDVSATDSKTSPPYITSTGNLLPGSIVNTPEKIWIDLATNAESGAKVYVSSVNGGLKSATENFTVASASADLAAASSGFGLQGLSASQTAGGPLSISAPYNVAAQNVGIVNSVVREAFSASAPITAGRGSLQVKAKTALQTPAANDYQDIFTLTAAAAY